jgi:hypothetical protein
MLLKTNNNFQPYTGFHFGYIRADAKTMGIYQWYGGESWTKKEKKHVSSMLISPTIGFDNRITKNIFFNFNLKTNLFLNSKQQFDVNNYEFDVKTFFLDINVNIGFNFSL